ncbi:MAG: diguanylate cyclase [Gammaproteobacteria bacterium]|nr:diguanylate cyclase [Gammaproteobacteria bacterium]
MTIYSSQQNPWMLRYKHTLQSLERKDKAWRKREGLLKLIASWLILAADPHDEVLNKELQELRVELRKSFDDHALRSMVDRISISVARLSKLRKKEADNTGCVDIVTQSLDCLKLPADLDQSKQTLVDRINFSHQREGKQAIVAAFTEFVSELILCKSSVEPLPVASVSTLQGASNISVDKVPESSPQIHEVLIQLIEKLDFPIHIRAQADVIIERMRPGLPADGIGAQILEIVDLISRARLFVQAEKRDIERFLEKLSIQLQGLDRYLSISTDSERQTAESRIKFSDTLGAQMREIGATLSDANDLVTVKSDIQIRLDTIQQHLESERRMEADRARQAEQEIVRLREELKATEIITDELRNKVKENHELAMKDSLTGLFNRTAYEERVCAEFEKWKRYGRPLSIVIIDVDHFKNINDTFGHNAGDRVLKSLSEVFCGQIRKTDLLVRYGGEEFVLLASESDKNFALNLAEKLRQIVHQCKFHYEGNNVSVTISCGVSSFRDGDTPELVLERADMALYRAKALGRNSCLLD